MQVPDFAPFDLISSTKYQILYASKAEYPFTKDPETELLSGTNE